MNAESPSQRERLLQLDPPLGTARADYERKLGELFERRLSRFERLRYVLLSAAGAVVALGLGSLALTEPDTTPPATRAILGVLAAMGATWFFVALRLARLGSVHLIVDRGRVAAIVLAFSALQCVFFAWISRDRPEMVAGFYVGLTALLLASAIFIAQRIRESELRSREEFLRASLAHLATARALANGAG